MLSPQLNTISRVVFVLLFFPSTGCCSMQWQSRVRLVSLPLHPVPSRQQQTQILQLLHLRQTLTPNHECTIWCLSDSTCSSLPRPLCSWGQIFWVQVTDGWNCKAEAMRIDTECDHLLKKILVSLDCSGFYLPCTDDAFGKLHAV